MKISCQVLVAAAVFSLSCGPASAKSVRRAEPEDDDAVKEADALATEVNQEVSSVKTNAQNAKEAADTAKQAAIVANKVADHSVKVTTHAKSALKHALHALHDARVDSEGLGEEQETSLKKAEAKLKEATQTAKYGKLKKLDTEDSVDLEKQQMKRELDENKDGTELEQMRKDVKELRKKLKAKGGDAESDKDLAELEAELERLEKDSESGDKKDSTVNDEMKAEIDRLREQIEKSEQHEKKDEKNDGKELMRDVDMKPLEAGSKGSDMRSTPLSHDEHEATPVEEKGIDIDTSMPYGDLEPFGREDTAQELTESSVRESDMMVDQLERAEVAEEKRAVFRALTRLRGAAITSFDGVARSQTGNIDEYNKVHKWRKNHPLHHLADEESDITKWAFPDNADLIQVKHPGNLPDLSKWAKSQL